MASHRFKQVPTAALLCLLLALTSPLRAADSDAALADSDSDSDPRFTGICSVCKECAPCDQCGPCEPCKPCFAPDGSLRSLPGCDDCLADCMGCPVCFAGACVDDCGPCMNPDAAGAGGAGGGLGDAGPDHNQTQDDDAPQFDAYGFPVHDGSTEGGHGAHTGVVLAAGLLAGLVGVLVAKNWSRLGRRLGLSPRTASHEEAAPLTATELQPTPRSGRFDPDKGTVYGTADRTTYNTPDL